MTDLVTLVTLEEAKAFLRVDFDDDDDLVEGLISTATDAAVAHVGSYIEPAPAPLLTAVLMHVAALYDDRSATMPEGAIDLLERCRARTF